MNVCKETPGTKQSCPDIVLMFRHAALMQRTGQDGISRGGVNLIEYDNLPWFTTRDGTQTNNITPYYMYMIKNGSWLRKHNQVIIPVDSK